MLHRRSVLHQKCTSERSVGTEGKQIVERFGVVALGVDGPHRVQNYLSQPGLSLGESKGLLSGRQIYMNQRVAHCQPSSRLIAKCQLCSSLLQIWHHTVVTIRFSVAIEMKLFIPLLPYKLAFDQPGTWSQKYNLVWDRILDLHLFPANIMETEWAFYAKQMQTYGLPLDNRKIFTKLDWEVWTGTRTDDPQQFQDLLHRLVLWADNTPSGVPTTDWYDSISGRQMGFQARSGGGIFIKAILDPQIASRWTSPAAKGN
jgi:hypothetical protein